MGSVVCACLACSIAEVIFGFRMVFCLFQFKMYVLVFFVEKEMMEFECLVLNL